jgi:hypothetical protein
LLLSLQLIRPIIPSYSPRCKPSKVVKDHRYTAAISVPTPSAKGDSNQVAGRKVLNYLAPMGITATNDATAKDQTRTKDNDDDEANSFQDAVMMEDTMEELQAAMKTNRKEDDDVDDPHDEEKLDMSLDDDEDMLVDHDEGNSQTTSKDARTICDTPSKGDKKGTELDESTKKGKAVTSDPRVNNQGEALTETEQAIGVLAGSYMKDPTILHDRNRTLASLADCQVHDTPINQRTKFNRIGTKKSDTTFASHAGRTISSTRGQGRGRGSTSKGGRSHVGRGGSQGLGNGKHTVFSKSSTTNSDAEESDDEDHYDLHAIVRGQGKSKPPSDSSHSDNETGTKPSSNKGRMTDEKESDGYSQTTDSTTAPPLHGYGSLAHGYRKAANFMGKQFLKDTSQILTPPIIQTVIEAIPVIDTTTKPLQEEDAASETTTKTGWQSAKTSKNTSQSTRLYSVGVHVSKMVQHDEGGFHPDDITMLLDLIQQIDPTVLFLPYNNNQKLMRTWKQLPSNHNFTSMMNVKLMPWGRAAENKTRTEMSFYIASDSIASIRDITSDLPTQAFLSKTGFRLGYHALHESSRRSVGFLLGKSVAKAYWNDLTDRLSEHIQDTLKMMRHLSSQTAKTGPKETPIPAVIPIQLNPTTLFIGEVETKALSIFVGVKDKAFLERLLQKYPLQDVEIVADSWKRSDPDEYANRLTLHNILEENSTAIKITDTSEDMRLRLRADRYAATCADLIIDVAEGRDTPVTGLLYVQCLLKDRPAVLQWVQDTLEIFMEDNPDTPTKPIIAGIQPKLDSPKNSVRTFNTTTTKKTTKSIISVTPSRYAHILTAPNINTTTTTKGTKPSRRDVPKAINVKVISYAQILARENKEPAQSDVMSTGSKSDNSNTSKSDNSTLETTSTSKTQREIELEHINETLTQETKILQQKYDSLWTENTGLRDRLQQVEEESQSTAKRMNAMEKQLQHLFQHMPSTTCDLSSTAATTTTNQSQPTPTINEDKTESKRKRQSPQKEPQKRNPSYPQFFKPALP